MIDWESWTLLEDKGGFTDEARLALEAKAYVNNVPGVAEFLGKLSQLLVLREAQEAHSHFKRENTESKEIAVTRIETYRAIVRLIESLVGSEAREQYRYGRERRS